LLAGLVFGVGAVLASVFSVGLRACVLAIGLRACVFAVGA